MKKIILFSLLFFQSFSSLVYGQKESFIVLGDMHYDKFEYHDLDYVMTRPQDFKHIFI